MFWIAGVYLYLVKQSNLFVCFWQSTTCCPSALIQDSSCTLSSASRRLACSWDSTAGGSCRFFCSFARRSRRFVGGSCRFGSCRFGGSRRPLGRTGGSFGHFLRRRGNSCGGKRGSLLVKLNRCFCFSLWCHLRETQTLHTAQHVRPKDHVVGADTGEPGGASVDLRSRQAEELTRWTVCATAPVGTWMKAETNLVWMNRKNCGCISH